MDKKEIIIEVKKTAKKNNNIPLGIKTFTKETGIKEYWILKYWTKWSDASYRCWT